MAGAFIELTEIGEHTLVRLARFDVRKGAEAGPRPATLVTFRDGNVVSMRH